MKKIVYVDMDNVLVDFQSAFESLSKEFVVYILATAPWNNNTAWRDKLLWVQKHLGEVAYKRLIISHHKDLNRGHYLIDDRTKNGAGSFEGELILFGSEDFGEWTAVLRYLLD